MATEQFLRMNETIYGVSKAAIAAIVLLNSGAWLALLSQASSLLALNPKPDISGPFLLWATGAGLGTFTWLCLFVNVRASQDNITDPNKRSPRVILTASLWIGVIVAIAALVCFVMGAYCLAATFS
jgi:hypothetical protein